MENLKETKFTKIKVPIFDYDKIKNKKMIRDVCNFIVSKGYVPKRNSNDEIEKKYSYWLTKRRNPKVYNEDYFDLIAESYGLKGLFDVGFKYDGQDKRENLFLFACIKNKRNFTDFFFRDSSLIVNSDSSGFKIIRPLCEDDFMFYKNNVRTYLPPPFILNSSFLTRFIENLDDNNLENFILNSKEKDIKVLKTLDKEVYSKKDYFVKSVSSSLEYSSIDLVLVNLGLSRKEGNYIDTCSSHIEVLDLLEKFCKTSF